MMDVDLRNGEEEWKAWDFPALDSVDSWQVLQGTEKLFEMDTEVVVGFEFARDMVGSWPSDIRNLRLTSAG